MRRPSFRDRLLISLPDNSTVHVAAVLSDLFSSKGLVTNYGEGGGLQNGRWGWHLSLTPMKRGGGHVKFYPYEKGRAENVSAMLKGGEGEAQQVLG